MTTPILASDEHFCCIDNAHSHARVVYGLDGTRDLDDVGPNRALGKTWRLRYEATVLILRRLGLDVCLVQRPRIRVVVVHNNQSYIYAYQCQI